MQLIESWLVFSKVIKDCKTWRDVHTQASSLSLVCLCTIFHAHTHIHRLLSFSVTLRLQRDLDLIAEGLLKDFPEENLIMWHTSPSLTPYPLSWPYMSMRMKGWTNSPRACMQLQSLTFSCVISPRWVRVKVMSEWVLRPNWSQPLSEFVVNLFYCCD